MVLVKSLEFCERLVLSKIQPERVFGDNLIRKQAFLDNIDMDLKRRQNWHFYHDFGQKVEVFSCFVFTKNRSRESVC